MYHNPYAGLDAAKASKSTVTLSYADRDTILRVYGQGIITTLLATAFHHLANDLRDHDLTDSTTDHELAGRILTAHLRRPDLGADRKVSPPDDGRRVAKPRSKSAKINNNRDTNVR
jgi:hypothetical protein